MITCHITYVIDPAQLDAFEEYGRMWMEIVNRLGGVHHGYFLPSEGASDVALAIFSFPSLAAYEKYRGEMMTDPKGLEAKALYERTRCFLRYDRTFFRPMFAEA